MRARTAPVSDESHTPISTWRRGATGTGLQRRQARAPILKPWRAVPPRWG